MHVQPCDRIFANRLNVHICPGGWKSLLQNLRRQHNRGLPKSRIYIYTPQICTSNRTSMKTCWSTIVFLGPTNKSTGCGTAGPALWRRFIGRLCLCRRTFAEVCDHEPDYCAAWAQNYEFCGPVWPGLTWLARSPGLFWLVGVVRLRYTAKLDRGYFRCSLRLGLWLNPSLLERGPHFTCAECSIVCCFCWCGWLLVTSRLRIHSP